MVTKNISITEEAYKRLACFNRKNESFSEIIMEITVKKRAKLRDFHGVLSGAATSALEKSINESRARHRKMHEDRIKRLSQES